MKHSPDTQAEVGNGEAPSQSISEKKKARRLLADVYNWFTKGLDTADLKEAKALLEELSM